MDLGAPVPAAGDFRHHFTDRLELRPFSSDDLDEVYALMSDPRVWEHLPAGVHTSRRRTAVQLSREEQGWELDGLGYWTARLREDGTFAGVGGCRLVNTAVWNLYYRIRPELQSKGYATELARAALAAARAIDASLPIVASVFEHNAASRAVAAAVGLRLVSQVTGQAGIRLLYCDRDVDPEPNEEMQRR